jgi:HEAT repeat protein
MQHVNAKSSWPWPFVLAAVAVLLPSTGCHDGPLYGLKVVNPYYSMKQWKADEALGTTDHVRRAELTKLVRVMPTLPPDRQAYWAEHLRQVMEHDPSPEMRRLAIMACGSTRLPQSKQLLVEGIKDESLKVRLTTCEVLGRRDDPESLRLLADTAGSTTDLDVRNAAFAALGNHRGPIATEALRMALEDRDPATRSLAVDSLRRCTGKNYGNDPDAWLAALSGQDVPEQPVQIAERLKSLIY